MRRDRDISEPTEWVSVGHGPQPRSGSSRSRSGELELQERDEQREREFYQHGRQYSSFTQTLLRDLPSRTAGTVRRRRSSGGEPGMYATIRSRRSGRGTVRSAIDIARAGDDVDAIVDAICEREGEDEIQDAHVAREMELNTLRELERPLSYKREVKQRLDQRDRSHSRRIGCWERLSSSLHYSVIQTGRAILDLGEFLKLWKGHLQRVRGQLGSGVATYFEFLESLFYLNLATVIIVVGFLLTPQLLLRLNRPEELMTTPWTARPAWERRLDTVPTSPGPPPRPAPYGANGVFHFRDLFTGQGWLNSTELYYGFYHHHNISLSDNLQYNMPRAYFFTVTLCLAIQLVVLGVGTARLYRTNFIDASSVSRNVFFNKVLCSWDYSIAAEKMAALRHQAIYNELKEMICDAVRKHPGEADRPASRRAVWLIRLLANTVVVGVLTGVGYLTLFLLRQQRNVPSLSLRLLIFPVVATVIVYVLPFGFSELARLELYRQLRHRVYVTLARTILLELVILGVTVGFWLDKGTGEECWENELGQGIYQLVMMEFIFTLALSFVGEFARNQIYSRTGWTWLGRPKFELANNTMFLVYSQTLVWLGLYFSPLICAMGTIKLFCSFYVKKFSCLSSCEPVASSWRAAQTRTVFQLVAFASMMGAMVAVGVVVFRVSSSSSCGPFRDLDRPWHVVTDMLDAWHPHLVYYLSYVTSPGVVVYISLILCILVYFGRNVSLTQERRVAALRGQLVLEGQDKRLLLRMIDRESRRLRDSLQEDATPGGAQGGGPGGGSAGDRGSAGERGSPGERAVLRREAEGSRSSSALNRTSAGGDRNSAGFNRNSSVNDKSSSAMNRNSAGFDRNSSSKDRNSAGFDRNSSAMNRNSSAMNRSSGAMNRSSAAMNRSSAAGSRDSASSVSDPDASARGAGAVLRNSAAHERNSAASARNSSASEDGVRSRPASDTRYR